MQNRPAASRIALSLFLDAKFRGQNRFPAAQRERDAANFLEHKLRGPEEDLALIKLRPHMLFDDAGWACDLLRRFSATYKGAVYLARLDFQAHGSESARRG